MKRGVVGLAVVILGVAAAIGAATGFGADEGGAVREVGDAARQESAATEQCNGPITTPTPVIVDKSTFPPNPDAGLSDDERMARIEKARASFEERYRTWLAEFVREGRDPRCLPRVPSMADSWGGESSLVAAVAKADLIVVGTAQGVEFEAFAGARVKFGVQGYLKGGGRDVIVIRMGGGPFPGPDYESGVLVYDESAPLLLPGDRAVLFLERGTGDLYVQPWSGLYSVSDGQVQPVEFSPFADEVAGLGEREFLEKVVSLLR